MLRRRNRKEQMHMILRYVPPHYLHFVLPVVSGNVDLSCCCTSMKLSFAEGAERPSTGWELPVDRNAIGEAQTGARRSHPAVRDQAYPPPRRPSGHTRCHPL